MLFVRVDWFSLKAILLIFKKEEITQTAYKSKTEFINK